MESTPIREDTLGELFAKSKLRLDSEGKVGTIYRLQAPPHLNGTVRRVQATEHVVTSAAVVADYRLSVWVLFCRDKDDSGVSCHGQPCEKVPAPRDVPGGGDGHRLQDHHSAVHREALPQRPGKCECEDYINVCVCTS